MAYLSKGSTIGGEPIEIQSGAQKKVDAHAKRKDNPHDVSPEQIGAIKVVTGQYVGNGSGDGSERTIPLGFTPKMVIVYSNLDNGVSYNRGSFSVKVPNFSFSSHVIVAGANYGMNVGRGVVENGFVVSDKDTWCNSPQSSLYPNLNNGGSIYNYIAFL